MGSRVQDVICPDCEGLVTRPTCHCGWSVRGVEPEARAWFERLSWERRREVVRRSWERRGPTVQTGSRNENA